MSDQSNTLTDTANHHVLAWNYRQAKQSAEIVYQTKSIKIYYRAPINDWTFEASHWSD